MNTILFDLDGTLLPMDMDAFMKIYFNEMGAFLSDIINPKELAKNVWASTDAMVASLDDRTNEEVFMEDFASRVDGDIDVFKERFYEFYDNGFLKAKEAVTENEFIKKAVEALRSKGYNLVIATNPLFPLKAIEHRIRWAGFKPDDFSYITHYEKNHYCKPQIKYYEEILKDINKKPEDCLMVGNDVQEDLVASELGIKTYLIKDNLLHRTKDEIKTDFQGNYEDFYRFVESLPTIK